VKHTIRCLASAALLAAAILSTNASPVSATPANAGRGDGCSVADASGVYHFDAGCKAYLVTRFDANGNLVLFEYQDAGQVPAGAPLPTTTIRNEFEQCFEFGSAGVICGQTVEVITPSGVYKSSFKYR
jgi:hypothetical protein